MRFCEFFCLDWPGTMIFSILASEVTSNTGINRQCFIILKWGHRRFCSQIFIFNLYMKPYIKDIFICEHLYIQLWWIQDW
jgi:hypothetical protein